MFFQFRPKTFWIEFMEPYLIPAVIAVGFISGFINTIAGGGSLLSLPLLIFLGLPANVANGTNRIAILLQNAVGATKFRQYDILEPKKELNLAIPAIVGSIAGAFLAVDLNELVMQRVIGGLLIVMFFLLLFKPDKWIKGQEGKSKSLNGALKAVIFFFIGLYGGFIQAGVGFFLLAGLVLGAGYDLVKANAVKVFIVLFYTIFALLIFILNGQVNYLIGLILATGNMAGAYFGARFAVSCGAKYVRYFVMAALIVAAMKLIGLF